MYACRRLQVQSMLIDGENSLTSGLLVNHMVCAAVLASAPRVDATSEDTLILCWQ